MPTTPELRQTPDLVIENARIWTGDPQQPWAESLAVSQGRFLAVRSGRFSLDDDVPRHDMGGAFVMPGIHDAHAHMDREGLKTQRLSLAHCTSIADIQDAIRRKAATLPEGEWIVTMPLGQGPHFFNALEGIRERRPPNRHELDEAAPSHAVYIPGLFGNWGKPPGYYCLNSLALQRNGLHAGSQPSLPGITLQRDDAGELTGVIVETTLRPVTEFDLLPAVPRFSLEDRIAGLEVSMQRYSQVGITSVYEGHGLAPLTLAAYRHLHEQKRMSVRAHLVLSPTASDVAAAEVLFRDTLAPFRGNGLGDDWLRMSGVHIAWGGNPRLASLSRQNLPDTGWSGFVEQGWSPQEYRDLLMLLARYDLRLNAIVSDQLHEVVPILREVHRQYDLRGRRWVIEHIGRARREDLQALRDMDLWTTTIPTYFLWKGGHAYLDEPDNGEQIVPHQTLLELGIPLAIATDNIPYHPFFTIQVVMQRQERLSGRRIGPGQALSLDQALRLFTHAGAGLSWNEHRLGIIRPGYLADFIALGQNPFETPVEELHRIGCTHTFVDGRCVYQGEGRPPQPGFFASPSHCC